MCIARRNDVDVDGVPRIDSGLADIATIHAWLPGWSDFRTLEGTRSRAGPETRSHDNPSLVLKHQMSRTVSMNQDI